MDKYAILVAGGSGQRMGASIPKQFLKMGGKPILMHTLEAFHKADFEINLIITLPKGEVNFWKELCEKYSDFIPHTIVEGGKTRYHSVKNALEHVDENSLVAIHDGVRPHVSKELILKSYEIAQKFGSAICSVMMKDSVRQIIGEASKNIPRESLRTIQTPQTFHTDLIKLAYDRGYSQNFTDDASVAEAHGHNVHLIEGAYENIKITTPEDLIIAEAILKAK